MMRFATRPALLTLLGLTIVAVAIAAMFLSRGDSSEPKQAVGCAPEVFATETALSAIPTATPFGPYVDLDALNELERREAQFAFRGVLCGIEFVAPDQEMQSPGSLCDGKPEFRGGPDGPPPTYVPSELNKPAMTQQTLCNDGRVVATYSGTGVKAYFRETPKFATDSIREHIRVMEIDGVPVVFTGPPTMFGTYFFYAIKRPAVANKPGIFLAGGGFVSTQKGAIELAQQALRE